MLIFIYIKIMKMFNTNVHTFFLIYKTIQALLKGIISNPDTKLNL